jgi:far upstream element-binding protein
LLIGPRGITQKQLQESSGAKIIIRGKGAHKESSGVLQSSHPDDEDDLHVSIEGTEESVEKAYKDIQEILYNPEQALKLKENQLQSLAELNGKDPSSASGIALDEYQIELRVPNNMVGLVIGKGGENIHKMQTQTGAHMQIAKESDMKPGKYYTYNMLLIYCVL